MLQPSGYLRQNHSGEAGKAFFCALHCWGRRPAFDGPPAPRDSRLREKLGSCTRAPALAAPDTEIMDLNGKYVLPGFVNTHVHTTQQISRGQGGKGLHLRTLGRGYGRRLFVESHGYGGYDVVDLLSPRHGRSVCVLSAAFKQKGPRSCLLDVSREMG